MIGAGSQDKKPETASDEAVKNNMLGALFCINPALTLQ